MPPEPNDVRVLIPRVRRAIDGPAASGSASLSATLDDEGIKNLVADSIASILFFTNGAFPHTLDVEATDAVYGSPTEWSVNPALTEPETAVVAAQAALDYFFVYLKELKTSETIRDEGQEWTYSLSSTLVRDQMSYLRALRDKALETLVAQVPALDGFVNFVASRDALTARLIEPYLASQGGLPILTTGLEGIGGIEAIR